MTDKEKAIVMAYTGITMLSGEKFSIFHKYVQDIMGRPVFTHELADEFVWEQIKERSRADFIRLCKHSDCYWGTKDTDAHIAQCLTTCHNPKIRAVVTDEYCAICRYDEPPVIEEEANNETD